MKVLVTGAHGFIGTSLIKALQEIGVHTVASVRDNPGIKEIAIGNIDANTHWYNVLEDCEVVVHLAARVHKQDIKNVASRIEFHTTNSEGTLNLARQSIEMGIRRFIFLSSIKVEQVLLEHTSLCTGSFSHKRDVYAFSKWEAEKSLMQLTEYTNMEVVILRPPLVYGPGVGANFLRLMRVIDRAIPLPFSFINNLRSFIYLDNLIDAIVLCLTHPNAANKIYSVSDGEDVSTPELSRRIAKSLGRPLRLFPVPYPLMKIAGKLMGKSEEVSRLCESCVLDSSAIRSELGWKPPYSMCAGLTATSEWYRQSQRRILLP